MNAAPISVRALPKLRRRVEAGPRQALAGARTRCSPRSSGCLDLGRVRVGNDEYAKTNKSFGATTLRDRHATFKGGKLRLEYRGKSGKTQCLTIEDRRLTGIVKKCQDLPGQRLFQYVDDEGARHPVTSSEVNAYIREATGSDFTAKNFRTWGASVLAFEHMIERGRKRAVRSNRCWSRCPPRSATRRRSRGNPTFIRR